MQFDDYIALVGKICVVFGQCLSDYIEWFYMISHSFMTLGQPGDPPRVLPVQQYDTFVEPDVPQQPVAAAALDEIDVDVRRPRHAVVIYFFLYFVFVVLFFVLLLTIFIFFFHLLGWLCSNC